MEKIKHHRLLGAKETSALIKSQLERTLEAHRKFVASVRIRQRGAKEASPVLICEEEYRAALDGTEIVIEGLTHTAQTKDNALFKSALQPGSESVSHKLGLSRVTSSTSGLTRLELVDAGAHVPGEMTSPTAGLSSYSKWTWRVRQSSLSDTVQVTRAIPLTSNPSSGATFVYGSPMLYKSDQWYSGQVEGYAKYGPTFFVYHPRMVPGDEVQTISWDPAPEYVRAARVQDLRPVTMPVAVARPNSRGAVELRGMDDSVANYKKVLLRFTRPGERQPEAVWARVQDVYVDESTAELVHVLLVHNTDCPRLHPYGAEHEGSLTWDHVHVATGPRHGAVQLTGADLLAVAAAHRNAAQNKVGWPGSGFLLSDAVLEFTLMGALEVCIGAAAAAAAEVGIDAAVAAGAAGAAEAAAAGATGAAEAAAAGATGAAETAAAAAGTAEAAAGGAETAAAAAGTAEAAAGGAAGTGGSIASKWLGTVATAVVFSGVGIGMNELVKTLNNKESPQKSAAKPRPAKIGNAPPDPAKK
jgi:hypothetical protein